jgi:hypothetical protein
LVVEPAVAGYWLYGDSVRRGLRPMSSGSATQKIEGGQRAAARDQRSGAAPAGIEDDDRHADQCQTEEHQPGIDQTGAQPIPPP